MHFNGRFIVNMAQFAAQQGGDMNKLLALTGKPMDELCHEECKLDVETYDAVVNAALEMTDDDFYGMHAGENLNLQAAGLIVQIAHSSETVKQALEYCCEFANLGCSAIVTALFEEAEHYRLTLTPDPVWVKQSPLSVQHTLEGYLAFTIREFQSLTRHKHHPREVLLAREKPENTSEFDRVLGCPARFGKGENAILFEKNHVEDKVVTSDYALLQVLVAHAQTKLEQYKASEGFYDTVKRSVVTLVKPEFPTIEMVAGHLNMSVRTFQRKLKEEGYSYKELIDELRKDFALSYLKNNELSIGEVAYLLSYSDASVFTRSFKRWTGQTPKQYRAGLSA